GANWLAGQLGADTLEGGGGADTLEGGAGGDTFRFSGAFGRDRILDFAAGAGVQDVLELSLGAAFDTFAEVMAVATQEGADTVIRIDADRTITLVNVNRSTLAADDFAFI
ncbi:MAG: calcium-binding protein, partial [Beijerinckiaceae bacterium]